MVIDTVARAASWRLVAASNGANYLTEAVGPRSDKAMGNEITWSPPRARDDVVEHAFNLDVAGNIVPGVMWLPRESDEPPSPVLLLGHGGSGHKRSERNLDLARRLTSRAGVACVAIDGPYHGDRVQSPLDAPEYQALIEAEGLDVVVDRMVSDWRATIEALSDVAAVDTSTIGYFGLSMGTRFGVPLAAALGDSLRCAVFGKFGLVSSPGFHRGMAMPDRMNSDARKVTASTFVHVQWDDQQFPRDGQFALFDAIGTSDKRLVVYPGVHAETDPQAIEDWCDFVQKRLSRN